MLTGSSSMVSSDLQYEKAFLHFYLLSPLQRDHFSQMPESLARDIPRLFRASGCPLHCSWGTKGDSKLLSGLFIL
jgi:hypothetical protein